MKSPAGYKLGFGFILRMVLRKLENLEEIDVAIAFPLVCVVFDFFLEECCFLCSGCVQYEWM